MKNRLYKILFLGGILINLSACNKGFLTEYSQDLTRPKTPKDLHEIFFGGPDGYIPSYEIDYHSPKYVGSFLNFMDDDVSMVDGPVSVSAGNVMQNYVFGYYAWQTEVGLSFNKNINSEDNQLWNDFYHRINAMNILIKHMDEISVKTDEDKEMEHQVLGEAYFLRAQLYFVLANLYAKPYSPEEGANILGVPIKLTEYVEHDKAKEVQFPRKPLREVYDVIINDLNSSISEFSKLKNSTVFNIHIASLAASKLLLSRVYLYTQDWSNAEKLAAEVLQLNGGLAGIGAIGEDDFFIHAGNREILFSQGTLSLQGSRFIGADAGSLCVSSDLFQLYADNDFRKKVFFVRHFDGDSIALRKYDLSSRKARVSDIYTLRTAEVYLNKAEAAAMQGKEAEARATLEILRETRYSDYAPLDPTYAGDKLIDEIRNERRRELCFEGQRWFDLRRYSVISSRPLKKKIIHPFISFDQNNKNQRLDKLTYELEADDDAYVLAIPKSVIAFDPKMQNNIRPKRMGLSQKESKGEVSEEGMENNTDGN